MGENFNQNLVETGTKNPNSIMKRRNSPKHRHVAFHFVSVLIIVALATYLVITQVRDEKQNTDITNLVCFSCDFISGNTKENVVLMKEGHLCCTSPSEGYKLLARLISDGHSRISYNASPLQDEEHNHKIMDVRNESVAAHVYLNTKNSSLPSKVVLWTRNVTHSFLTSGLNYSESTGIMTVTHQGIYYIYSQLVFSTHSALSNSMRYDQLYQQIWLRRANNESLLMFWKQYVNSSREYMPSFLGGNFQLKKDDEIYVTASDPQSLYKLLRANFFGLHYV